MRRKSHSASNARRASDPEPAKDEDIAKIMEGMAELVQQAGSISDDDFREKSTRLLGARASRDLPSPDWFMVVEWSVELAARKRFREKLKAFPCEIRKNGKTVKFSVLDLIEQNGLDTDALDAFCRSFSRGESHERFLTFRADWRAVAERANAMRHGAAAIRAMAEIELAYRHQDTGSLPRDPSARSCVHPDLEASTKQAEFDVESLSLSSDDRWRFYLSTYAGQRFGSNHVWTWESPYTLPRDFTDLFWPFGIANVTVTDDPVTRTWERLLREKIARLNQQRGFSYVPPTVAGPRALGALADIMDDLAAQTDALATQLRQPKGRRAATAERLFRRDFAAYARKRSGRFLDSIGAALFSLTFQQAITPDEYRRLRAREARAAASPRDVTKISQRR